MHSLNSSVGAGITTEDLGGFFLSHFSKNSAASVLFKQLLTAGNNSINSGSNKNSRLNDGLEGLEGLEVPEDLGIYSDGTQRTLTDAQIAFLRQSELRSLATQKNSLVGCGKAVSLNQEGKSVSANANSVVPSILESAPSDPLSAQKYWSLDHYNANFGQFCDSVRQSENNMDKVFALKAAQLTKLHYWPASAIRF